MLPEGHSAGALTKDSAMKLLAEIALLSEANQRYKLAVAELQQVLQGLDLPPAR